jgi:hypothetical protein
MKDKLVWALIVLSLTFGGVMAGLALHEDASAQVCAATEDSVLTDCHGHNLQYENGHWK